MMKTTLRQNIILWLLEKEMEDHYVAAQHERFDGEHPEADRHTAIGYKVSELYIQAANLFGGGE